MFLTGAVCAALLVALPARAAQIVYVTDELRLGMYDNEQTKGRPFESLVSGDRLEVLERSLMSIRVRTDDGEEGWVKTAYVVSKEPARRRVAGLEKANGELEQANAELTAKLGTAEDSIGTLRRELASVESEVEELPALREAHAALEAEAASRKLRVPVLWVAIAVVVALMLGTAAGYYWLDRKVRSHFGGIRPY
jgi:hypothetical protein